MGFAARRERDAGTSDKGVSFSVTCLDSKQISTAIFHFLSMYFLFPRNSFRIQQELVLSLFGHSLILINSLPG